MEALGIDIGGTGIKAAPVDVVTGQLLDVRNKIATPQPATPEAVTDVVRELAASFGWTGPAGATFPGVITRGVVRTAANVDKSWVGTDAATLSRAAFDVAPAKAVEHGAGVDAVATAIIRRLASYLPEISVHR